MLREDETPVIDVVIPVYRGLEQTRRCIESVLHARQITPYELVLIDDASPEPELSRYLDSLAGRDGVAVLRNERNLGFVETVNRGMRLHPERDVVLLNSDTEVANDWLDRLRKCVHSASDIATATPFSNYATICSYPVFCADNPMPPGVGVAELDGVFQRVNAGRLVDLPTAVGFCMYIRRACVDLIGLFDAGQFGRGYGEENDFSRRAAKAGWRNVLCADTFVFHAGGVSFGDERAVLGPAAAETLSRLHPEYAGLVQRFVAEDAPAVYRRAVDKALARRRKWRKWAALLRSLKHWRQRASASGPNPRDGNESPERGHLDFGAIYRDNGFRGTESRSGTGSSLVQTRVIREAIPELLSELKIGHLLDVPCGDWNWMRHVDLSRVRYTGGDVVAEIVDQNNAHFGSRNCSFERMNIVTGPLPKADLILCRDCLVHLNFSEGLAALDQFRKSGATWLLTTTFTERDGNTELHEGDIWRPLNLEKPPYNLPRAERYLNEGCTEDEGQYGDKSLGLWKLR